MARGKQTCRILKEIRRQIAEANDIEFITSECTFRGDCLGSCPKCEAEVHYLAQQLRARSLAGKAVALAGISAAALTMLVPSVAAARRNSDMNNESSVDIFESYDCDESDQYLPGLVLSEVKKNDGIIFTSDKVDEIPQFPGGKDSLDLFISEHINYPEIAIQEYIQGPVMVKFYVDTLGHVCEPKIVRSRNSLLDMEAIKVMKLLPDFIPGKLNGENVNVWMTHIIMFKIPRH